MMMPDMKQHVLAELIKYLRQKEMGKEGDMPMDGQGEMEMMEKKPGMPMEKKKEDFEIKNGRFMEGEPEDRGMRSDDGMDGEEMEEEDGLMPLDEDNLDDDMEEGEPDELNETQERLKDFFANKRPKSDRQSRTFFEHSGAKKMKAAGQDRMPGEKLGMKPRKPRRR